MEDEKNQLGLGFRPNLGFGLGGNSGLLGGLAVYDSFYDVNQLWFFEKEVHLDGYRFKNCRFESSKLFVSSTKFELIDCMLDDKTTIIYSPDILKIIKLWYSRSSEMYSTFPYFTPQKNANGTITIKSS
ncbi:hypothetical protein [Cellvibrio sp. UBA7661]|uniref:hypothetical protein n=1 Tax=Cellvibrio sp. UBA7661 TaxID=1946311 RepID=UPI002F35D4F5